MWRKRIQSMAFSGCGEISSALWKKIASGLNSRIRVIEKGTKYCIRKWEWLVWHVRRASLTLTIARPEGRTALPLPLLGQKGRQPYPYHCSARRADQPYPSHYSARRADSLTLTIARPEGRTALHLPLLGQKGGPALPLPLLGQKGVQPYTYSLIPLPPTPLSNITMTEHLTRAPSAK